MTRARDKASAVVANFASTGIDDNADANAITINSSENVGIGITTPDAEPRLHVRKGDAGGVDSATNSVLTLENNTTAILQFLTPNTANQQIRFGDPQDTGAGFIQYNHTDNAIQFGTNGPEKMRLNSSGHLGIGFTPKTMHPNVTSSLNVGSGTVFQRSKDTFLASNTYYNASDAGTSISSGHGLAYYQDVTNGSHQWFTSAASAGSADAAHSFTVPMAIDSSGRVTMPYQPSFAASRSQGNVNNGVYVFPNVYHNTGNHYNSSNGRFTAGVTGSYFISTNMMNENNATYSNYAYEIRINGTLFQYVYSSSGSNVHHRWNWSGVMYLQAGDYVDINVPSNFHLYGNSNLYTHFSGHLLG